MSQDQQLREALQVLADFSEHDGDEFCSQPTDERILKAAKFARSFLTATQQAAPSRGEVDRAYGYAKRLAESIWERHYKDAYPNWEAMDTLIGILTQIDNMAAGLLEASAQREQPAASKPESQAQGHVFNPHMAGIYRVQGKCGDQVIDYTTTDQADALVEQFSRAVNGPQAQAGEPEDFKSFAMNIYHADDKAGGEVVAVRDLPLGARFSYQEYPNDVWVLLERHGCGLCARWQGTDGSPVMQPICSITETPEDMLTLKVVSVDTRPQPQAERPAERVALSDAQTADLWNASKRENLVDHVHEFKRAVEAAHGITAKDQS